MEVYPYEAAIVFALWLMFHCGYWYGNRMRKGEREKLVNLKALLEGIRDENDKIRRGHRPSDETDRKMKELKQVIEEWEPRDEWSCPKCCRGNLTVVRQLNGFDQKLCDKCGVIE